MLKLSLICLLIAVIMVSLPGCSVITGESVGGPTGEEIPVNTEFGRMLATVPYSVFEEHDIWFGNPGILKSLYGLEDINSFEEVTELPEETRMQWAGVFFETGMMNLPFARYPEIHDLIGFNIMAVDRAIYGNVIPPRGFSILEGDFDEALIGQKLIEQGYTKTEYGKYSYYGIRGDFQIDMMHPMGQVVLASMNRVAVLDDLIILSPVTSDITGIFDAMAGDVPSVIDNAVCRALADSLGDTLMATLTTPERIIYSDMASEGGKPLMFDFTVPEDWGSLQGYEMAALGCRADGENRFFDIVLYYQDKDAARADGKEIVRRIQTYKMGTCMGGTIKPDDSFMLANWWQPGEPVVTEYAEGVILKITCSPISETPRWISTLTGSRGVPFRDLLFLVPDPAPYIGENEGLAILIEEN